MRVAVISCKKQKQIYACEADEMYSKSFVYRAQRNFIKPAYDQYLILSSKYGLIKPDKVIEPYDKSIYKNPSINFDNTEVVEDATAFWIYVEDRLNKLLDMGCEIDFHTSNDYYKPLSKIIKTKVNHIKQPKAFGLTQTVYNEAEEMFNNGDSLDTCLTHITKKRPSKYNEQPKWFYHPQFGEYFGKTSDLHRKYPNDTDEGTLYQLSTFRTKQHKGWVINKELLPELKQTDSGQWRLKKKND
jgi:hypothetical protein